MLSDRARSARSENFHLQTQMSCHIATFAKDPGLVVSCHVATFAKNLGTNDIDICPNPRDKYAHPKEGSEGWDNRVVHVSGQGAEAG